MTNAALDAGALLRRLHEAGVNHLVIGGLAGIAHGVQRFTNDLDICPGPDRENLARLATLLRDAEARQLGLGDLDEQEFPQDEACRRPTPGSPGSRRSRTRSSGRDRFVLVAYWASTLIRALRPFAWSESSLRTLTR
jgi:hypothetical protein